MSFSQKARSKPATLGVLFSVQYFHALSQRPVLYIQWNTYTAFEGTSHLGVISALLLEDRQKIISDESHQSKPDLNDTPKYPKDASEKPLLPQITWWSVASQNSFLDRPPQEHLTNLLPKSFRFSGHLREGFVFLGEHSISKHCR